MRSALLALSASLSVALAAFACSSSTPAATEDDAGSPPSSSGKTEDTSTDEESPPSSSGSNASGSSSGSYGLPDGGEDEGGASSSGGSSSGGTPIDGGAAGTLCLSDSVQETEPNDTEGTANEIPGKTGSFCGRLSSAGDVDYVKFTLPANAKTLNMSQKTTSGAIKIEPTADGAGFSFSGSYPIKPGKVYMLKISTTGGALDYRIGVTIGS